jgi:hypothetical protein
MDYVSTLLQGISFIPAIVSGIEDIFGERAGVEKKDAAMTFLQAALSMGDAIMTRRIVDEAKFKQGLGEIIDGVVECLNASAWAKAAEPTNPSA